MSINNWSIETWGLVFRV